MISKCQAKVGLNAKHCKKVSILNKKLDNNITYDIQCRWHNRGSYVSSGEMSSGYDTTCTSVVTAMEFQ